MENPDNIYIKEHWSKTPIVSIDFYLSSIYQHKYVNGIRVTNSEGEESEFFGYSFKNGCDSEKRRKKDCKTLVIPSNGKIRNILVKQKSIDSQVFIAGFRIECKDNEPIEFCSSKEDEWKSIITSGTHCEIINIYGIKIQIKNTDVCHIIEDIQFFTSCPSLLPCESSFTYIDKPLSSSVSPIMYIRKDEFVNPKIPLIPIKKSRDKFNRNNCNNCNENRWKIWILILILIIFLLVIISILTIIIFFHSRNSF